MNYILLLVNLLSCIIYCGLAFDFMIRLFEKSYSGSYFKIYVMMTGLMFIINSFQNTYLNYLGIFLFFFTLCQKLFFSHKRNIYLYTLLFISFLIIVEVINIVIANLLFPYIILSKNTKYIFISIYSLLLNLIFYRLIVNKLADKSYLKYSHYKIELMLLIISLLIIINLCSLSVYDIPIFYKFSSLLLCIIIVLCDVFYVNFMEKRILNAELVQELEIENVRKRCEYYNYEEEKKNYTEQRKIIHDIKDHLLALEKLYSIGNREKAKDYSNKIMSNIDPHSYFSRDPIIQVLLNKIHRKCIDNNIEFIYKENTDIDMDNLSDFNKVTIFSNILNNAYEAVLTSSNIKKYIILDIQKLNDALVICLRNSYNTKLKKDNAKYISTKHDHLGIGLDNVKKTVEQLGGMINISSHNKEFEIIIYISN